jgi:flagellar hook-basal body complex protein FliE
MTVMPLEPDLPFSTIHNAAPPSASAFGGALSQAFAAVGGALENADAAERAFAHGHGGLQEMMVERVQADVALSIAATAASRATQAVSAVLGMQV